MSLPFRLAGFYFMFFAYAGVYVAWFPVYLAARGLGPAEIAWVLALPPLARIVAPAAWGWLADRTGAQRTIVAFSCAANAACFALLPFADGLTAIAWLMGTTALLAAAALPLVEAITLSSLAEQHGRYGPIRVWGSIGFIATVLGGGAWLDRQPVETLPGAMLLFALGTLGVALSLPRGGPHTNARRGPLKLPPAALALLGAGFFMAVAHATLYAFFTLHLRHQGYSGAFIGVAWTLGVLAEIFVFLFLPALFRRYALSTLLAASCGLAVLRFLAIGWFAEVIILLLAAQLLHAASFGSFHAAAVATVHRIFPPSGRSRGQTLFSSLSYGAGGASGAMLAGLTWEAAGAGVAFSVSALAALMAVFLSVQIRSERN